MYHACLTRDSFTTAEFEHSRLNKNQSTFHLFYYYVLACFGKHVLVLFVISPLPCQVIHHLEMKAIHDNEAFPARLRYVVNSL